jgi:hypothetical protein
MKVSIFTFRTYIHMIIWQSFFPNTATQLYLNLCLIQHAT